MTTIKTTWGETIEAIVISRGQSNTAFVIEELNGTCRFIYDSQIVSMNFIY